MNHRPSHVGMTSRLVIVVVVVVVRRRPSSSAAAPSSSIIDRVLNEFACAVRAWERASVRHTFDVALRMAGASSLETEAPSMFTHAHNVTVLLSS